MSSIDDYLKSLSPEKLKQLDAYLNNDNGKKTTDYPTNSEDAVLHQSKFWPTQPVQQFNDKVFTAGPIKDDVQCEYGMIKLKLPENFKWDILDMRNMKNCETVAAFLRTHYRTEKKFCRIYSPEFLHWYFSHPNYNREFTLAITGNDKLVGFCAAIPNKSYQMGKEVLTVAEVNFLCVHRKLKKKRMAPILMRSIINVLALHKIKYAVWDTSTCLTQPLVSQRVYNRIIDVLQLMDKEFIQFDDNVNADSILNTVHIPKKVTGTFVKMEEEHLTGALKVLNTQFDQYTYHPVFSQEEFKYLFYDNPIVSSFVLLNTEGQVVDMASYYNVDQATHEGTTVKTANLFYYTALTTTRFQQVRNLLIKARDAGFELFTASDVADDNAIDELGFEKTDNIVHSFVGNWKSPPMKLNQVCRYFF